MMRKVFLAAIGVLWINFVCAQKFSGMSPSLSSLFRGQTGCTNPNVLRLPVWTRRNLADAQFVSENSALLPYLSGYKMALHPVVARSVLAGGLFGVSDSYRDPGLDTQTLIESITDSGIPYHEIHAEAGMRGMVQDVGFSIAYSRLRRARLTDSESVAIDLYRDIQAQLAVGGTLFDREDLGRMELGTGLKGVFRTGDEKFFRVSNGITTTTLADSDFNKWGIALGLDYGFVYTFSQKQTSDWIVQLGLAWKNVGTTPFFVGPKTSKNSRFEPYRNDLSWGLGVGVPNIIDHVATSFRLEYNMDPKLLNLADRFGAGLELRWPVLLSLNFGIRGNALSGGVLLRYSEIEIEAGTYVDSYRSFREPQETKTRFNALEFRAVF